MKLKLSRVALTTMSLLPLLTACGGADNKDYQPKEKTLEVKAIDGYLRGAIVWLDVNGNNLLDSDEPHALTTAGGRAALDVTALGTKSGEYPLMVEVIAGQTIDESAPETEITQGYVMTAPAGYKVITPLTTLVQLQILAGKTQAQAEAAVKKMLQQDIAPSVDYIEKDKPVTAGQAATLVRLLPVTAANLANQKADLEAGATLLGNLVAENPEKAEEIDFTHVVLIPSQQAGEVSLDRDGDGVSDKKDAFPTDKSEWLDTDTDGPATMPMLMMTTMVGQMWMKSASIPIR